MKSFVNRIKSYERKNYMKNIWFLFLNNFIGISINRIKKGKKKYFMNLVSFYISLGKGLFVSLWKSPIQKLY